MASTLTGQVVRDQRTGAVIVWRLILDTWSLQTTK